jgi:hypothetical protein
MKFSRRLERLFYCLISILVAVKLAHAGPAKTVIADVVYRADGSAAAGSMIITWLDFTSADGYAVAAGNMTLAIGAGGAISVALVPNAGSTPAGTFYKVVYKLDDGTTSTEYWSVPSASPTTIGAIRTTVVPPAVAAQFVTQNYLASQLALKANDNAVVHTSGNENVAGVKTFAASPSVPAPVNPGDAVNLSYINNLPWSGIGICPLDQYVYALVMQAVPLCRPLGSLRFADQFSSIQSAINDAGASGEVIIPKGYSGNDSYTNSNNINVIDYRGAPDRYKGFVNVKSDCGAVGDGVTDDGPAINACIVRNPGRTIFFPKVAPSNSGSGTATNADYYSSQTIVLNGGNATSGNATVLYGEQPGSTWSGRVEIKFPAGVDGIVIPSDCASCGVFNVELIAPTSQCFSWPTTSTYRTDLLGNGVIAYGAKPSIVNVEASCFGQNGILIDGSSPPWIVGPNGNAGQPDIFNVKDSMGNDNQGWGMLVYGGDSNGGYVQGLDIRGNKMGGLYEHSALGNSYNAPVAHANGTNTLPPGGNGRKCGTIWRSSNVVTCSASSGSVSGFAAGQTIAVSGVTGATTSFNGFFTLTAVNSGAGTVSWAQTASNECIGSSGTCGMSTEPGNTGGIGWAFPITSISGSTDTVTVNYTIPNGMTPTGLSANEFIAVGNTGVSALNGIFWALTDSESTSGTATFTLLNSTGLSAATGYVYVAGSWDIYGIQAQGTAVPNGATRVVSTAQITAGQTALFARNAQFDTHDAGAAITVKGAGAAGGYLSTTIASVTNPYTVQLTATASTTVSNATVEWSGGYVPAGYKCDSNSNFDYLYTEGNNAGNEMTSACTAINGNVGPNTVNDLTFGSENMLIGQNLYTWNGFQFTFLNGGNMQLMSGNPNGSNPAPQPFKIGEYNPQTGLAMSCLMYDWNPPSNYVAFLDPGCGLNTSIVYYYPSDGHVDFEAPATNGHMQFGNTAYGNDYQFYSSNGCAGCTTQTSNGSTNFFIHQNGDLETFGASAGDITLHASGGIYNWNWPTSAGSAGQVLTSQGGGSTAMTWSAPSASSIPSGSNVIVGNQAGEGTTSSESGFANYTMFCELPAFRLLNLAAKWKVVASIAATTIASDHSVVLRTARNSLTVIDSTPLTWSGSQAFTFAVGDNTSDAITLQLDTSHDYYIAVHFTSGSSGSLTKWPTGTSFLPPQYTETGLYNGFSSGDQTGVTTLPTYSGDNDFCEAVVAN